LPDIFRCRDGHALNTADLTHLDTERPHTRSLHPGRANGDGDADADRGTEPQPNADGYAISCAQSDTRSHTEAHSLADGDTYPDAYTDGYADPDYHTYADGYAHAHSDYHTYTNATSFRERRGRRCRVPGWLYRGIPVQEGGCYLPRC